jgi:hypothetical protein
MVDHKARISKKNVEINTFLDARNLRKLNNQRDENEEE